MQNHVLDYLDETVKRVPDKLAYANETTQYTFADVYRKNRSVASWLAKNGYYKEPVVVFMRKSPEEIVTFFGTIQAGCFYVPIDEEMPFARVQLILENCKARVIICDRALLDAARKFEFTGELVCFDEIENTEILDEQLTLIRKKAIDTDPIYIVFTSGSTGIPKGVCACHRSVLDYIEQLSEVLGFDENTVFGNQTPLYFDACLKELYPTIKFGATTWLIPHNLFSMPVKLVEYMNEKKINTVCWVVSALTMISAFRTFDTVVPKFLRTVAFGSEVFPVKQFHLWKNAVPEARFVNLYGPTEGTGMCCYYPVEREFMPDEVIPIGFPFKNTEIMLLDENNKLAEEGEICIRGTSVTLGYYNNPEKTSECFVQNPLNTAYPEIIYRTGDIGRRNERGELVFVSRKDYQIKHMGHRIELGEIEVNVNLLEGVKMSGCVYDQVKNKIILFYVGTVSPAELSKQLKERLPRYMIPNNFYQLDEMPFTANGKIDRIALKNKLK
ncbi:MAG: amino acid adenylation domain-containing protein [Lachnospiraceae bacterium]|nr:amino acid adenylation domain-containing protein [Lachnospiraceae bacterium]